MGLDKIRQEIDSIDTQMKELFLKRMELSKQVANEKKLHGGAVFVPEREQELILSHSKDVDAEKLPEYQAFVKQIIGISRTYQYSILEESAESLNHLPKQEAFITVEFDGEKAGVRLAGNLDAVSLAGLALEKISVIGEEENKMKYQLCLSGDFSRPLARGAILQLLEENKNAVIV